MSVPSLGVRRAPASLSRSPLPACRLQPEPPGHPALRPVPILTEHGFFKEKNQRTCGCRFSFSELTWDRPGSVRRGQGGAASAAHRPCSGGFTRAAPLPAGYKCADPPSRTPHPGRVRGPRGRTYRLGGCASRSRSQ